jgi:subtilase family serine protease
VIAFKPSDPALLAQVAASASGRPPFLIRELRRLFSPPAGLVRSTAGYLRRFGFTPVSSGVLTQTYQGTVRGAQQAFRTRLSAYRAGRVVFRSPSSQPTLPAAIASHVEVVDGLDTYPVARPLGTRAVHSGSAIDHAITSTCPASTAAVDGGYEPAGLAGATGYDFQSLLDASNDGSGEVIDMLEFSNDNPADVSTYKTCYGVTVPVSNVAVNGGTTTQAGAVEVELDDEVATTAAPGLDHLYNYMAPISTGWAGVVDKMLTDSATTGVTAISISWGACEAVFPGDDLAAADHEFQLAAAAGISVYAASGDDGSSDCARFGSNALAVDYPASDPYVTAVGGTGLHTGTAVPGREVSWGSPATGSGGGGGGGVSRYFPMPSWQTGTGVIEPSYSSMTPCGQTVHYCRELPDVSLNANPDTGYVIYCTNPSQAQCAGIGWLQVGGTSAASPLMAAITADANTYSLANGGARIGFASPFLYSELGTSVFRDVTLGSNNILGGAAYPAGAGYDMSTGLGSPDGAQLAPALAGYTAGSLTFDTTALSGTQTAKVITPQVSSTLKGTLLDSTTAQPLADRPVIFEGVFRYYKHYYLIERHLLTDSNGVWSTKVGIGTDPSRMQWFAAYPGEEGINSALTILHTLYVRPTLTLKSPAGSHVPRNSLFALWGYSNPHMRGVRMTVQVRRAGSRRWRSVKATSRADRTGRYAASISIAKPGTIYARFHYTGTKQTAWLTANSNAKKVLIT